MTNNPTIQVSDDGRLEQQQQGDFSDILIRHGLAFKIEDFYFRVGSPASDDGWELYLSVVTQQVREMLELVIPELKGKDVPFRAVSNKEIAREVQDGHLGFCEIGKVITIYPRDETEAVKLAQMFQALLKGFYGPKVLDAAHLEGVIYAGHNRAAGIIPFQLPEKIQWPFAAITPYIKASRPSVLNGKYKISSTIKEDAKGFVWHGIFLKNLVQAKPCVIKEGRAHMMRDEHGRDISDRLQWQLKLHKELADLCSLPSVYDFFRESGNTYLVLEYIDGPQLDGVIADIYNQRTWQDLSGSEKIRLVDFGLRILENISAFHKGGFVHRDINTGNFLVTDKDTLVLIDLELAYSIKEQRPTPPFVLGTEGFMSPEQQAVKTPTIQEDIYAIGATMIVLFTGMLPTKFETGDTDMLEKQLSFFVPEQKMVSLICSCMSPSVEYRPGLAEVTTALKKLREGISNNGEPLPKNAGQAQPQLEARELIQSAIQGLASPLLLSPEGLWYSKTRQNPKDDYAQVTERSIYGGFHSGQSGVLYTLAKAREGGLSVKPCMDAYYKALGFLQETFLQNADKVPGGLFHGMAGIGLAAAQGIKSGLLATSPAAVQNIEACFSSQNIYGFDLENGAAGQGMAILQNLDLISPSFGEHRLQGLIGFLLEHQKKDGSWISGTEKIVGFNNGVAGITAFLIAFLSKYPDVKVEQATLKALGWLEQQKNYKEEKKLAIIFLRAYKVLGIPRYLQAAGQIFNTLPERISTRDQGQDVGLAGLGELYLEASSILQSGQFKQRADWIAGLLVHQYKKEAEGLAYWQVDESGSTTADFMTGNAGVIHFLLRWQHSGKFFHPFLS